MKISKFLILSIVLLSSMSSYRKAEANSMLAKKWALISLAGGAVAALCGWNMGEEVCDRQTRQCHKRLGNSGKGLMLGGVAAMIYGLYSLRN